jgi:hypothetical protein
MALTSTKTSNMSGQSKVGDTVAAYLSANLQSDGSMSITKTFPSIATYAANQTAVDADIVSFEAQAINMAKGE